MDTEVETTRAKHPSVLRKGLAGVVLIVAVALILKLVIGFVIAIFWTIVAVALVIAILWAIKTLVW
ncbi:MAG TPA: hypothetical protein VGF81_09270 [Solirubrobacteraceae bacterium]|jgi:hypothetical protein